MPDGFQFDDPSHMVRKDIIAVLHHWRAAQEANKGQCAFRFKAYLKSRGDEDSELIPAVYEAARAPKGAKGKAGPKKKKKKAVKSGKGKGVQRLSTDDDSAVDDDTEHETFNLDIDVGSTSDEDDDSEDAKGAAPNWALLSRRRRQQWLEAASPSPEFRVIVDALPRMMVVTSFFSVN